MRWLLWMITGGLLWETLRRYLAGRDVSLRDLEDRLRDRLADAREGSIGEGRADAGGGAEGAERVPLNDATLEELQALPGIGPVLAQRIVDARPFEAAGDLREVEGIGEEAFEELAPHVRV